MYEIENVNLHEEPNGPGEDNPYPLGAWVPVEKDPARWSMQEQLPETAEVSTARFHRISTPSLNQGNMGSCVGHSGRNFQLAEPVPYKRVSLDGAVGAPDNVTPAVALYYDAQRNDGWDGGEYPGATPVYSGTSLHGLLKAMVLRGEVKDGYVWADSPNTVRAWLRNVSPVMLATRWTNDMFRPDANGFVHPSGGVAGGHAFLVFGADVDDTAYCYNQWGDWGVGGTFTLPNGQTFTVPTGVFKISKADLDMLWNAGSAEAAAPIEIDPNPAPGPAPEYREMWISDFCNTSTKDLLGQKLKLKSKHGGGWKADPL